jgi:hypothetical protein
MNMSLKNILLITAFIFLTACESEEILGPEATYEEYTVVQGVIEAGKYFPAVRFTKTLPLGVAYDIQKAELKNVTAYVVKNGVQVIPLIYTSEGLYKPLYDFYTEGGETYELFAESEGKYIYGRTLVPFEPEVSGASYHGGEYYLTANVKTKADEVYCALWTVYANPLGEAEDFYSVSEPSPLPNNIIAVRTAALPETYRSPAYSESRFIQVFAFDISFRDYFYSRNSGGNINDPFIQGGGKIEWNMQGDKVIGMFIGYAAGEKLRAE